MYIYGNNHMSRKYMVSHDFRGSFNVFKRAATHAQLQWTNDICNLLNYIHVNRLNHTAESIWYPRHRWQVANNNIGIYDSMNTGNNPIYVKAYHFFWYRQYFCFSIKSGMLNQPQFCKLCGLNMPPPHTHTREGGDHRHLANTSMH